MRLITCKCGQPFYVRPSKAGRSKYCSNLCKYEYRVRPSGLVYKLKVKNPSWFRRLEVVKPNAKGYIERHYGKEFLKEHRKVMQDFIGRKLSPNEVVHHKNGIKTDNRIENLEIMSKSHHDSIHRGRGIKSLK